jgi:Cyclin D1 binding domain
MFVCDAIAAWLLQTDFDIKYFNSYGESCGDVLINVTYVGDTMLAAKVTGEENVPRGELTFTVDLTPRNDSLDPLKLRVGPTSEATTRLPRYYGRGQVAKRGFADHKFVEGQLVMFERHFSFVWVPIRHHVLFRRPTPEQTLTLLRDQLAKEDELENVREYLRRCFQMDMTDALASQASLNREDYFYGQDPLRRISTVAELEGMDRQLMGIEKESWFQRNPFWHAINFLTDGLLDKNRKNPHYPLRNDLEKA